MEPLDCKLAIKDMVKCPNIVDLLDEDDTTVIANMVHDEIGRAHV